LEGDEDKMSQRIHLTRHKFESWDNNPNKRTTKAENLWNAVRRWAKANGYEYMDSYGVVGVAPA